MAAVDIDPGWYEGQPETAEEAEQGGGGEPGLEVSTAAGATQQQQSTPGATAHTHVPTVLTKLQKWGDYASFGEPVGPSRFVPMKTPLSELCVLRVLLRAMCLCRPGLCPPPPDSNSNPPPT
jgi:hypothetical protein